jgi:hypothetical protein
LRGGEAVISCYFLFFSRTNSAITSLTSYWQRAETKKLSMMGLAETCSVILMIMKRRRPATGRMVNWSIQKMMRTEVMLSCPELLIELLKAITVSNSRTMLESPIKQFRTTSDLLRAILPSHSFASSVGRRGSAEIAGIASILTESISIYDSP